MGDVLGLVKSVGRFLLGLIVRDSLKERLLFLLGLSWGDSLKETDLMREDCCRQL